MTVERSYRRGNYGFNLLFRITDADTGRPRDITGLGVTFRMWVPGQSTPKVSGPCVMHDSSHGECRYHVEQGDFDEGGLFFAELELSDNGVLESTEVFEITIYGPLSSVCPQNVFEYSGDVSLTMYVESDYSGV